jgi:hypothetical protein
MLAFEEPAYACPLAKDVFRPPAKPKQLGAPLAKQISTIEDRNIPLPITPPVRRRALVPALA